ncbi:MAG: class I SAM-dependent methyltransferase [Thiohalomonadaceae bacterium]
MHENREDILEENIIPGDAAALRRPARVPATTMEKALLRRFLGLVGGPALTIRLWDGTEIHSGEPPRVVASIADRTALWRLMLNPSLCFGEEYSTGGIDTETELTEFMRIILRARPPALDSRFPMARLLRRQLNTLSGSRENIHHHYDIGNAFYELWLDREMAYTCAYYPDASATLAQAQFAKMELVCRKLRLQPNETVVEAGCGWGGLARHMARHYGVKVKAFNISREQIAYARERAAREGLDKQIEYVEDDYRAIRGRFDAFVSVGMLEHVGVENLPVLGDVIDRCLAPQGRGLIHSIGQNRSEPLGGWIARHIFPGAYPPTLREMMTIFEPRFSVLDVENLRPHYARTCEQWLARFDENIDQVRDMFDERFVRAWRLYLAASHATFAVGHLQLFQVVFARPRMLDYPWTRAHLYGDQP